MDGEDVKEKRIGQIGVCIASDSRWKMAVAGWVHNNERGLDPS